jgi:hypothetical protein
MAIEKMKRLKLAAIKSEREELLQSSCCSDALKYPNRSPYRKTASTQVFSKRDCRRV